MDRHIQAEYDRLTDEQDKLDILWEGHAYRVREAIRDGNFEYKIRGKWVKYSSEVTDRIDGDELMRLYVRGDFNEMRQLVGKAVAEELNAFYELTFTGDGDEE